MGANFTGITFAEFNVSPSDDGLINRTILPDGILSGCEISYSGSTLTMASGTLIACGRQFRHPAAQNWAVVDATTGYARLLITLDLTRSATDQTFDQVVDAVEYANDISGFPALVQQDLNAAGTKYQIVACVVSLGTGGISGIINTMPTVRPASADGGTLTVTAPAGATVTVSKDGKTLTRVAGADGVVVFRGLETGTWTLSITDGEQTASKMVEIVTDYATEISYNVIPEFTYTGDFEIVNDSDEPITASQDNWKIRFLTSGTLTFTNLNVAENGIDVFCVGGGGASRWGGGGGGYTTTGKRMPVSIGTPYDIVIGAGGGSEGANGGETSAFGVSAKGGYGGSTSGSNGNGGNGGCGGGGWGSQNGGDGGTDGADGGTLSGSNVRSPGTGQGTTTREFGELNAKTYAGGGSGGYGDYVSSGVGGGYVGGSGKGDSSTKNGQTNTGGGGGGRCQNTTFGHGGSGIVVIRNAREVS